MKKTKRIKGIRTKEQNNNGENYQSFQKSKNKKPDNSNLFTNF